MSGRSVVVAEVLVAEVLVADAEVVMADTYPRRPDLVASV